MKHFYSAKTGGFYNTNIHEKIPEDAVEITAKYWSELIDGQQAGDKEIGHDTKGYPILIDKVINLEET